MSSILLSARIAELEEALTLAVANNASLVRRLKEVEAINVRATQREIDEAVADATAGLKRKLDMIEDFILEIGERDE